MALAQNQLIPAQFDYSKAAGGALVGLVAEDGTLIDSGAFVQSDTLGTHSVTIKGQTLSFNADGKCTTAGEYYGMTLSIVEAELKPTQDNLATRAGGSSSISIDALNPRDHFAITALQGIFQYLRSPHEMSDANMLYYSKIAYKWAQAMLVASADARKDAGESTGGSSEVSINEATLSTNQDKLLYNISTNLKDLAAQQTANHKEGITIAAQPTVKVDNIDDTDKLKVEGAGGGGALDFDTLLDINGNNVTSIPAFNNKAPGYVLIANLASRIIQMDDKLTWARAWDKAVDFFTNNHDNMLGVLSSDIGSIAQAKVDAAITKHITDYHTTP